MRPPNLGDAALTPPQAKRLATVTAQLALAGLEVREVCCTGGFVILGRGLTKHCPTPEHVEAAAREILGANA